MNLSKIELDYLIEVTKGNEPLQNKLIAEVKKINKPDIELPKFYSDDFREIPK